MKKSIVILLVALIALSSVFAAGTESTKTTQAKVKVGDISKTVIISDTTTPATNATGWSNSFSSTSIVGKTVDVSTATSYEFTVATLTNINGERSLNVSVSDFIQMNGSTEVDRFGAWLDSAYSVTEQDITDTKKKDLRVVGDQVTVYWKATDVATATSGDYICTVTLTYTQD